MNSNLVKDILTGIGISCVFAVIFFSIVLFARQKPQEPPVFNQQQMTFTVQDRPQRLGDSTIRILKHKGNGQSFTLVISNSGDVFLTPFDATAPSNLFPD